MREKELRLGVVLTGGVSLALYMHGVSRELLKLIRASRAFHARDRNDGAFPEAYSDEAGTTARTSDTEAVYFDLLKQLAPELDLRIMIDIISGASAGGVNGIMLARALAHDLNLEPHRDLWLENADVLHLIDEKASAGRWGKIYIAPIVAFLLRGRLHKLAPEAETRAKLMTFIRSRWFKPPFSGPRFSAWLIDASNAMEQGAPADGSLLPDGHPLDLYVSVTDFYGHTNRIALHDPPEIGERDHRHVLHYRYLRPAGAPAQSDFDRDAVPGLVFAARASSCFPGAFPPASLQEIDDLLVREKREWAGRERFITEKLGAQFIAGRNASTIYFVDGSVVNDKPFGAAIAAISNRPAHREVTRRLLYVQPDPSEGDVEDDTREPGFFRTILSSLAEIPRNEPIHDDLARIETFNRHIRLVGQVLHGARSLIEPFVEAILPARKKIRATQDEIANWRSAANEQAADHAGYAFQGYFRLKVVSVANRLEQLTCQLVWPQSQSDGPGDAREGFSGALTDYRIAGYASAHGAPLPAAPSDEEIEFLKSFDVDFRVRRLRFVIRRLNELYAVAMATPELKSRTELLDELKTTLYGLLDQAKRRWEVDYYDADNFAGLQGMVKVPGTRIEGFGIALSRIAEAMGLVEFDCQIDEVFSVMVLNFIPVELHRDLFTAYVGFAFFDVMSFPMVQWEDLEEFEEILIDRISPSDTDAIRSGGPMETLKGIALRRFGGFFNRSYRENDYLWGRLNAAERLVDIVLGAASETDVAHRLDTALFKRRLFIAILDSEEAVLNADPALIPQIRAEIAASEYLKEAG